MGFVPDERMVSFSFEYQLDQPEQVRASRVLHHREWSTRAMYGIFVVLFLIAVGLYVRDPWLAQTGAVLGLITIVAAAPCGAVAVYMSPYWMVRSLRKNNRAAAGPHRYSLHDRGLDISSPGTTATIEWANIVKVHETREFLLLYVSARWATLMPKRVVSAEELPRLRAALHGWVGERARLLTT